VEVLEDAIELPENLELLPNPEEADDAADDGAVDWNSLRMVSFGRSPRSKRL
jgi:hypothetical protein